MAREHLPPRRENLTQKFKIHAPDERGRNPTLYVTVGLKSDGTPGEIKIVLSKTGFTERAYMDALSYSLSIGMQNGVKLEDFVEQFLWVKFPPCGPVSGYDHIKSCTSPLDLAFRWLGIEFCQMWDLAVVVPPKEERS